MSARASGQDGAPNPPSRPPCEPVPAFLKAPLRALRAGEAVAFPTDTVYGIGVAVRFAPGPGILYEAKGRPASKPIPWLVGSAADLDRYGSDVPTAARELVRQGWPGPLTLVVRASEAVPPAFRSIAGTIALRMPAHPVPLALAAALGPIATTSANLSGREPVARAADLDPLVARACACVVADDGASSGAPSAIYDCTGAEPVRLR